MRQIIRYTTVILLTLSAVVLLWQFRMVLLLLVLSLALTAVTRPLLNRMARFRIPSFSAQLLVLIFLLGALGSLVYLLGPKFMAEIQRLVNYAMIRYEMAYRVWEADPTWQPILTSRFPEPSQLVGTVLGENGELLLPAALNLTQSLVAIFSNLFILLTFSLYWAQDQNHFERLWLSFLPPNRRIPARSAWRAVEQAVGGYLRQELALGLVAALLLGTGYALLGLPYPVALALLAFVGWFIPLLGFVIILIPVFISTIELGWGMVFLASAFTLLILLGLKYWIEPKYLHSRRYSSFLIVFWTVVLGSFLGPGGFLAGPAVAAAAQAIGEQYLPYWLKPEPVEIQLAALEQRYTTAFQRFREVEAESPSPELGNIFSRLDHSLQRAEELVESPYVENQAQ